MSTEANEERSRLKRVWPQEFRDGERCAYFGKFEGAREKGGYLKGFHSWPLDRRNAWYCGYNYGRLQRQRDLAKLDATDG